MADTAEASTSAVPFFKKKFKKSAAVSSSSAASSSTPTSSSVSTTRRKRSISPTRGERSDEQRRVDGRSTRDAAEDDAPAVVRLKKRQQYNPLKQGTSSKRLRSGQAANEGSSDDDTVDDFTVQYADRKPSSAPADPTLDHGQVLEGDAALAKMGELPAADGLYHGSSQYQSQLPTGASKYAPIKGPSANIRTITLMDYQADVCKDYKETGWCGFGDSCKFLHAREDYLHGWQMDSILPGLSNSAKAVAEIVEDELPFACLICREPFGDPPHDAVVTRCGHYYGSSCAIARFRKSPKCFACGASTGGIFNKATKILERREKNQQTRIKHKEQTEGADNPYGDEAEGIQIEGLQEES